MRETDETLNYGSARTRARKNTKEHNTTAARQTEIIKAQVAKMKEMLAHATARSSTDHKPDEPPPELNASSRPRARSRSRHKEEQAAPMVVEAKPPPPPPIPPPKKGMSKNDETR